jgi:uncharacterized protein (TIGR02569 family)
VPTPTAHVLAAFAADGAEPLAGRAEVFATDRLVLKRLDLLPEELAWQEEVLTAADTAELRVAPPVRSRDGRLVVDGWTAWSRVAGRHEPGRWRDTIEAGRRFHHALRAVPRPTFLDARTHAWAIGDRAAWGELPLERWRDVRDVCRLEPFLRLVGGDPGLIHGDLTGNVLYADGLPPAVIDFSPYWRPLPFADAIVVADALVWEGADESLLGAVGDIADFGQYLARALIYREVTEHEARGTVREDRYAAAVELALALL